MSYKISTLLAAGLTLAAAPLPVLAVGPGLNFGVDESVVPAINHIINPVDSIDFSYQDCTQIQGNSLSENGYFYASSFREEDDVLESQINYVAANGYKIYAKYNYGASLVGTQNTPSGQRNTYTVNANGGSFTLYLDRLQDTQLTFNNDCQIASINTADDEVLGFSSSISIGERFESNGLAQGDFKILYDDWQFTMFGQSFFLLNAGANYAVLVFNGNITNLQGPINSNHQPEGSGNIFWRQD